MSTSDTPELANGGKESEPKSQMAGSDNNDVKNVCVDENDLEVMEINNRGNVNLNEDKIQNTPATNEAENVVKVETVVENKENGKNENEDEATGRSVEQEGKSNDVPETSLIQEINNLEISSNRPKAKVVLKKESESLRNLMAYDSSDNESCDNNELTDYMGDKDWQLGSNEDDDDDNDEDYSDEDSVISLDPDYEAAEIIASGVTPNNKGALKKPKPVNPFENEAKLIPLPDLSKLKLDYNKEEFMYIGNVQAIIDNLVTIQALPNTPAYDLDTILFFDNSTSKAPLGAVLDVIGPVTSPIYCVSFKSNKEIEEKGIKIGTKVYSAPNNDVTQYVFVKELMKLRGSDASWLNDDEMPADLTDNSSDDDIPPPLLEKTMPTKRKRNSLERHQRFERSMNRCNTFHTRVTRIVDARAGGFPPYIANYSHIAGAGGMMISPMFDPSIPPPGFIDRTRFIGAAHHFRPQAPIPPQDYHQPCISMPGGEPHVVYVPHAPVGSNNNNAGPSRSGQGRPF